jgi:phosphatidylserine/phosphatidylglycerophosphate/cardiolipin synthase-like enzyme
MRAFILIISLFILLGCGGGRKEIGSFTEDVSDKSGVSIKPYFSFTNRNFNKGGGIDELIIKEIKEAKKNIRLAMYGFSNDRIRDAVIETYKRGIDTIIVTDDSQINSENIKLLKEAGIEVIDDEDKSALMHHKFLVIDEKIVWSGSANYSYYAFYKNNENLVRFTGSKIARVYLDEFDELYHHNNKEGAYVSDTLEIYFSPEDDFEQRLLGLIEGAKESIDFLAFAFTNVHISDALKKKFDKGIKIRGVFDKAQHEGFLKRYSKYQTLLDYHINVKLDGNKQTMHDKVFIIDNKTVVTGSYNFTTKANEENNENAIVVHNKEFALRYEDEFEGIFKLGL